MFHLVLSYSFRCELFLRWPIRWRNRWYLARVRFFCCIKVDFWVAFSKLVSMCYFVFCHDQYSLLILPRCTSLLVSCCFSSIWVECELCTWIRLYICWDGRRGTLLVFLESWQERHGCSNFFFGNFVSLRSSRFQIESRTRRSSILFSQNLSSIARIKLALAIWNYILVGLNQACVLVCVVILVQSRPSTACLNQFSLDFLLFRWV